jgi:hypothetical protein
MFDTFLQRLPHELLFLQIQFYHTMTMAENSSLLFVPGQESAGG